ncbi:MAG: hypothetical protein ACR2OJ_17475, partial [Hyphomicrobiales bacterium]
MTTNFTPAPNAFMSAVQSKDMSNAEAVIFGAPHGTPYEGIENKNFAGAPDALRAALEEDSAWPDHWDFDLDGQPLGNNPFSFVDVGNLETRSQDGPG